MKAKKSFLAIPSFWMMILILFSVSSLFSQQQDDFGEDFPPEQQDETTATDSTPLTPDEVDNRKRQETQNATERLDVGPRGAVKIDTPLVEDFEDADLWFGGMFIDDGLIQVRKIYGGDQAIRDVDPDGSKFVLGAKINFLRRAYSEASVEPPRPIRIPGFSRKISVWVSGRNAGHKLYAIVRDMRDRVFRISLGTLRFSGWKKLEALIPGDAFIIQDEAVFSTYYRPRGLLFEGFFIEFAPFEAAGTYYVYFDNLRFETNIYHEEEDLKKLKTPIEERNDPLDDW